MGEAEARLWLTETLGASERQLETLARFAAMVIDENARQNLIAKSTEADIWWRHIVDSAQLLTLIDRPVDDPSLCLVDLGSGAGFPGIVLAALTQWRVILCEMRPRRAEFLERCSRGLGLQNASIAAVKSQALREQADILTARAFAPIDRLFATSAHLARSETLWVLPKGRNAVNELAKLPKAWQTAFHVKQSVTDNASSILVGKGSFSGKRT